jgi:hypothetical protein
MPGFPITRDHPIGGPFSLGESDRLLSPAMPVVQLEGATKRLVFHVSL